MLKSDPHSFADPENARVTHLQWRAEVDFEERLIRASATWDIEQAKGASQIVFDTKSLAISRVLVDGESAQFSLGDTDSILGNALTIALPANARRLTIHYETAPDAEALQWLSPQQTAGKEHPFLFTQSQAILARTWIPCQDSPGIRFTYDAEVTVPPTLLALMSASNPVEKNTSGTYNFSMKQPIPSYLLALAVGDVAFTPLGPRSGVYAEPSMLKASAYEFGDLEKMIAAAEALYGAYRWDRYDLIVLPPSFPFGGMENPRLTFVTPTLLAGDRSLTAVVAHELAHSWSGNLVTNATWNDFWLNEGFTVYFETRIMEKLYGADHAEMLASLNLHDLKDEITSLTRAGKTADTHLRLRLEGRNPDDGVTEIAYNKGYFFLRMLEEKYGRAKFDQFLNAYFKVNAFSVMDTEGFVNFIRTYYRDEFAIDLPEDLLAEWIHNPGLPANCPQPVSQRFAGVDAAITHWQETGLLPGSESDGWTTQQWIHFLNNLPATLTPEQLKTLDDLRHFSASSNAEIFTVWATIAIANDYRAIRAPLEDFLVNTGRRKFLTPLYKELIKTEEGRRLALDIYKQARPNYHFVATQTIDELLHYAPPVESGGVE